MQARRGRAESRRGEEVLVFLADRRPDDADVDDVDDVAVGGADEVAGLDERFLEDGALGRIASVFVPTAVSAALIPWLGVYLSGALFLVFSMMTLGKVGLVKASIISVATMAVFFVTFEFWFQVPLAKGVVMPLLGIY